MEGLLAAMGGAGFAMGMILALVGASRVAAARRLFGPERFGWARFWVAGGIAAVIGGAILGLMWAVASLWGVIAMTPIAGGSFGAGMWWAGARAKREMGLLEYADLADDADAPG